MIVNEKEYGIIIWDWLYTLYNPDTAKLYTWVEDFFKRCDPTTEHLLVSFAKHPDLRASIISKSFVAQYLKEVVIDTEDKANAFEKLQTKYNFDKTKVLVIGDNNAHEGKAAVIQGYDFINVFEFAKLLGKEHL